MGLGTQFRQWWLRVRCPTDFLCDNCRYDHPTACKHPKGPDGYCVNCLRSHIGRPNATRCPDYTPRT